MTFGRKIITLLILALWLPYVGHCVVGDCHDEGAGHFHSCVAGHGHHDHGQPTDHECAAHRHDLNSPRHDAILSPTIPEEIEGFDWLNWALRHHGVCSSPAVEARESPPPPLPPHVLVIRAAHPVRGPSL